MQLQEAQVTIRNRRGRKRKQGRRKPSGDIIHGAVNYRSMALQWPHRRSLPESVRLHEKAETPFGGLCLVGIITDDQYLAGEKYRGSVLRYMASIQPPSLPPSIAGFQQPGGGGHIDDDRANQYRIEYDDAFASMHEAGHRAQVVVKNVAVNGEPLRAGELPYLRLGLDCLVLHYGLTPGRKNARWEIETG